MASLPWTGLSVQGSRMLVYLEIYSLSRSKLSTVSLTLVSFALLCFALPCLALVSHFRSGRVKSLFLDLDSESESES